MEESLQTIEDLIIRSCLGACTADEQARLEAWRREDKAHEDFYRRVTGEENLALKLHELSAINIDRAFLTNQQLLKRRAIRRTIRKALPYAALFAVAVGIALGALLRGNHEGGIEEVQGVLPGTRQAELVMADGSTVQLLPEMKETFQEGVAVIAVSGNSVDYTASQPDATPLYNTIRTPLGGEYAVVLSDGTEVWLNAMSELTYPVNFPGDARKVTLNGEAYFKVKRDTSRPFFVDFNGYRVEVLGTTFNVKAYRDEAQWQTTLCSGSVRLLDVNRNKTVMLEPGKQAFYDQNLRGIGVKEVETDLYIAWTKGVFRFDNTPVEEIFSVLKRWYKIDVFYENKRVRSEVFTGKLPRFSSLQTILNIMENVSEVRFELKGNTLVVR